MHEKAALLSILLVILLASRAAGTNAYQASGAMPSAPIPTPISTAGQSSGTTAATRTAAPQATHNLAFIGDSLTEGFYSTTRTQDFVYRTAAQSGMTLSFEGQYGVGAVATAQKMQSMNPRLKVVPGDAQYVIVELGTNDVVISGETLDQFQSSYDYILSRSHHDAPGARLVCLGTWRDPTQGASQSGYAHNQIIQTECARFGGSYVLLGPLYLNANYHGPAGHITWCGISDWFHPNDAGHAAIASGVAAVLN